MATEFGVILNTKKEQNFIKINVENIFFAENKVIKTGEYKNFEYTKLPKRYVYYENYNIPCYIYKDGNKIIINKKFDYNLGIDANIDVLAKTCIVFLKCYLVLDNEYNYSLSLSKTITLSNDEEHQAYEYYEDWILSQFKEYELLNNKELINEEIKNEQTSKNIDVLNIINSLKEKIKGQNEAIYTLVPNIVLNQKLVTTNNIDLIKTSKNNILIDGSTGTGKTLLTTEIGKLLNVPYIVRSSTNYSGVGYVGEDLKSLLVDLLRITNGDLEKAKRGIICLDEIDKLADTTLEIRKGISQELLTWITGTNIKVVYNKKEYNFDTSLLTFIFMGTFSKMRTKKKNNSIGFKSDIPKEEYLTKDYVSFGMNPEFMGRMSTIVTLRDLELKDYSDILVNSSISPLKALIDIGNLYNVEITYTEEFISSVTTNALNNAIGARGLQREINKVRSKILIPIMTNQVKSITLTSEMLNDDYIFEKEKTLELNLLK